eukprot:jgi/Astpho2/4343/Aster-x0200
MKVLEAKYAIVTNPEVTDLLKEQGVDRGLGGKGQQALWTYLTEQGAHKDSRDSVATFLGALKEHSYKLSRAEKVQLVNLRPQSDLELQLAIPNSLELSSDERVQELLAIIKEHLAAPVATKAPVEEA